MTGNRICFIDEGNSRVKWRYGSVGPIQSADSIEQMLRMDIGPDSGSSAMAASVRRPASELARCLEPHFSTVEIVKVQPQMLGLTSCYQPLEDLGVDRWLAMLAIKSRQHDSFVLMDAGSGITLDVVDAQGEHRGGLILPGLRSQRAALAAISPRLAAHLDGPLSQPEPVAGCSSAAALINSGLYAAAAALDRMASEHGVAAQCCYITGGDAELFRKRFPQATLADNLVLEGMKAIREQGLSE